MYNACLGNFLSLADCSVVRLQAPHFAIDYHHAADGKLDMRPPFDDMEVVATSDDDEMIPDPLDLFDNSTIREPLSTALTL